MSNTSPSDNQRTLLGTNLTPSEALRLIVLLCGPPWLLTLALIVLQVVPPPQGIVGWLAVLLAGPAAWGAFVSAIADGRTLLGRKRGTDAPRQPLWQTIHQAPTAIGDQNELITGDITGNVEITYGDTYMEALPGDPTTDAPPPAKKPKD